MKSQMDLFLRRDSFTFLRLSSGTWCQLLSLFLHDRVQTIPKRNFRMKPTSRRKSILSGSLGWSNLMDDSVVPFGFSHPLGLTDSLGTSSIETLPSLHPFTPSSFSSAGGNNLIKLTPGFRSHAERRKGSHMA